ncbi:hypothetical protein RB595_008621 [Gaeumannomyces hyphopodioides]
MPRAARFALSHARLAIADIPAGAVVVHATNGLGAWGSGVAAALAAAFPGAHRVYADFCAAAKARPDDRWPARDAVAGRCLLIPPQPADARRGSPAVTIACVFTSFGYGRPDARTGKPGRDGVGVILDQTSQALADLRLQLDDAAAAAAAGTGEPLVVYSPRFNSGAFKVPWERTASLIVDKFDGWDGSWIVFDPPS